MGAAPSCASWPRMGAATAVEARTAAPMATDSAVKRILKRWEFLKREEKRKGDGRVRRG